MRRHKEAHLINRIGWLRASVLGANDGIVSTASLIVGVAAAQSAPATILLTGIAGLVAGAMSMAAGEYVSVSSQADSESADRTREENELATIPDKEREELIGIYELRGLDRALAEQVADKLTSHDALATHLRDELGMAAHTAARPVQAALASAAAFTIGASLPLAMVPLSPAAYLSWTVSITALLFLAVLGAVGAKAGGAPIGRAVLRVTFWGAIAMAATAAIGALFGTTVA
ncbi:VIT family protein [Sphingorhabdus sp.]|jgi:VIT1/CCC1 family predicted Fe2+/Mn2+ transporter|uniref:VIT1/CCC1 transporter family protein n=1 Tax=Sphingorhabdus sp. TaxID=1902408 RepID=UPI0026152F24|nr:VIT family protein [Sphingorhabdus sp.]MDH4398073.1 VIT family protein [Sphingorhabdus sp.]